jgi:protein PhnA
MAVHGFDVRALSGGRSRRCPSTALPANAFATRACSRGHTRGCDAGDFGKMAAPSQGRAMSTIPSCLQCTLENTYPDGDSYVCADCGYEWPQAEQATAESARVVRDCNGNVLAAGDTVVVIKDLKVKGSSIPLKQGTVIRNIRLVEDDAEHIEGHSDKIKGLVLKVCFLRKA